jgi:SAM-dependent methyltransferase
VSEPPQTVRDALADQPVAGATCLEAGAGAGSMALALREAGAERVLAVTDDRDHASDAQERLAGDVVDVIEADLTATPVAADSVDIVTAHALFNVLDPATAIGVARECTRVAKPGARLIVDDYAPLPGGVARRLFDLEEAASRLAAHGTAYDFYPADHLATLFEGLGWEHHQTETLLEPLPWSETLLGAHADLAREHAACADEAAEALIDRRADALLDGLSATGSEGGRMYSVVLELPT